MLHNETEVNAFKEAKPRIEKYMESKEIPTEVGVFFYMRPFAITSQKRRSAQIETQKREKFPIYHVQAPIIGAHSLGHYGQDPQKANSNGCLLETAIEHSGNLMLYSPTQFDVDVHTGIFVYPDVEGNRELGPATYTVDAFEENRVEILENTREGFQSLEGLAMDRGLRLLLENEPLASYEAGAIAGFRSPRLIYKPFGTHQILDSISENRTFDTAHFASTKNVPHIFERNNIDPTSFFNVLSMSKDKQDPWSQYDASFCTAADYSGKEPAAIHLSNFEGIGVHLTDPELQGKWGKAGTNEGTLTPAEMKFYLDFAKNRQIPIVLEVDFDIGKIGENKFIEADNFLRYVYQEQQKEPSRIN
jgi:hypothetical protein